MPRLPAFRSSPRGARSSSSQVSKRENRLSWRAPPELSDRPWLTLALALGGRVIGLVLESDDIAPLQGLELTALLRSDRDDVPAAVREVTAGRGVDVALNAVGGAVFPALFESLAT